LTILYTNSANGYLEECTCSENGLGGLARRQTVIARHAEGNLLILDAGNLFSPYRRNEAEEKLLVSLIEKMNYAAINIGEQEFSYGLEFWKSTARRLNLVSANVRDRDGRRLAPPFQIFAFEGLRVAVTGVLDQSAYLNLTDDIGGEVFVESAIDELKKTMIHIRNEQPDLIILLLRSQEFEAEKKIAEIFPDIHLILSCDERLERDEPFRYGKTLAVSAGHDGEKVGKLRLDIDVNADSILAFENKLIELSPQVPKDVRLDSIVQSFKLMQSRKQ
jgi:2',3'-cyclic-nucleotide 2'-phosphodiesterase (5'-nucleotidase family)